MSKFSKDTDCLKFYFHQYLETLLFVQNKQHLYLSI